MNERMNEQSLFQHKQTKLKIAIELVMPYYKMLKKGHEGSVLLIILAILEYIMISTWKGESCRLIPS